MVLGWKDGQRSEIRRRWGLRMRLGLDFLWVDVLGKGRSFRLEVMEYSMGTWRSRDDKSGTKVDRVCGGWGGLSFTWSKDGVMLKGLSARLT